MKPILSSLPTSQDFCEEGMIGVEAEGAGSGEDV